MFHTPVHRLFIIRDILYYIKKYPVSLAVILTVIYLSSFRPSATELGTISNLDKVVHICIYFGMSGMLQLEFLRVHRKDHTPTWRTWANAFICPVLPSGVVELLQEYCTTYHDNDWLDFAADTIGAVLALLAVYLVLKSRM